MKSVDYKAVLKGEQVLFEGMFVVPSGVELHILGEDAISNNVIAHFPEIDQVAMLHNSEIVRLDD